MHTVHPRRGFILGISAYLITLAVLIPASGWIADRFGARAIFTLALAIFTLASVFCGLSTEVHTFVAMRILQGINRSPFVTRHSPFVPALPSVSPCLLFRPHS